MATILTLCMMISLLPTMSLTAFAATATSVHVGGAVLDATRQYANSYYGGTTDGDENRYSYKFDPETGTLIIKNAKLTNYYSPYSSVTDSKLNQGDRANIYADGDLTIILESQNTLAGEALTDSGKNSYGIYASGDLTIKGNGTINIKAGETNEG